MTQHGVTLGKTRLEETPPKSRILKKERVRRVVQKCVVHHANDEPVYPQVIEEKSLGVKDATRFVGSLDQRSKLTYLIIGDTAHGDAGDAALHGLTRFVEVSNVHHRHSRTQPSLDAAAPPQTGHSRDVKGSDE